MKVSIFSEGKVKSLTVVTDEEVEALRNVVLSVMYPYTESPSIEAGRIKEACLILGMEEEYEKWLETPLPF